MSRRWVVSALKNPGVGDDPAWVSSASSINFSSSCLFSHCKLGWTVCVSLHTAVSSATIYLASRCTLSGSLNSIWLHCVPTPHIPAEAPHAHGTSRWYFWTQSAWVHIYKSWKIWVRFHITEQSDQDSLQWLHNHSFFSIASKSHLTLFLVFLLIGYTFFPFLGSLSLPLFICPRSVFSSQLIRLSTPPARPRRDSV